MPGVRRKLLQRVAEFDFFEMCYPDDKDRARGNVAEIQKIVKLKDTLTKYENPSVLPNDKSYYIPWKSLSNFY